MVVVVVIVDHLVTIQLDVQDRITGDDTDLASSPERRTSEPSGERCGDRGLFIRHYSGQGRVIL